MANEQIALSFNQGITNVPSDATCDDNALEECMGMVFTDGEHRVIQKPEEYIKGLGTKILLYVHRQNNVEHYIVSDIEDNKKKIKWGTKNGDNEYVPAQVSQQEQMVDVVLFTAFGDVKVTSIGKTLIFTDDNGLHYYIWGGDSYNEASRSIPNLNFQAKMVTEDVPSVVANTGSPEEIIEYVDWEEVYTRGRFRVVGGRQEDFNNLVIGLYSKNKKEAAQAKGFVEPFFVRVALEMYDGTYTYITNPILLYPSVEENTRFYIYNEDTAPPHPRKIVAITPVAQLFIQQTQDYSDYSDIIKDVVVFASRAVSLYNTSIDQPITTMQGDNFVGDNVSSRILDESVLPSLYYETIYAPGNIEGLWIYNGTVKCLAERPRTDINKDLEETSLFYKIASIGLKPTEGFVNIGNYTLADVIENIETQESLKYDDYFSRNSLIPEISYVYNSRLNLANVSRGYFNGFNYFMPFDHDEEPIDPHGDPNIYLYTFDVTIKTDTGNVTVRNGNVETIQKQGIYFYYPDPRAIHVKIYRQVWGSPTIRLILDADLKEHPGLNGAYYFAGYSPNAEEPTGTVVDRIPPYVTPEPELLYNQIIQSEVNNPWAFLAEGYHTVGTGRIIGLSTVTQALSEGQFGQYPLLVFSENGIWGMSVDGKGIYSSMYPMSREVCLSEKTITQTDGAVFFASKKGLMVIVGSEVRCVSEQLSGRGDLLFADFLKDAIIAYDYRDSLLWLFDVATHGMGQDAVTGSRYCWVYSIKSGTFARYDFGQDNTIGNVVPDYPDYLLQSGGKVYSLLNRPDINHDGETVGDSFVANTYDATIVTRPMKFENALALKSIRQIRNVHYMEGQLRYRLFASNDLKRWVELKSLRGMSWKYFKMRFDFTDLKATDRFAGTVVVTEERNTNKLR